MNAKTLKRILTISLIGNLCVVYVALKALEYRRHINEFLEKYTYVVQEFSGRNDFEDANRKLSREINAGKRVVFIGTQVTAGWNLPQFFPDMEAVNRGISGQRMAGFLLRFRPDVVELAPKAVVIEFSSYSFRPENIVKELEDYIATMADIARFHNIEPLLSTVIPVGRDFEIEENGDYEILDSISMFNSWLREYVDQNKIKMADFAGAVADSNGLFDPQYSAGQIILNDAGYERISSLIAPILMEILNRPDSSVI